ncbi:hypothetical protein D3C73_898220 [compost metagenome]
MGHKLGDNLGETIACTSIAPTLPIGFYSGLDIGQNEYGKKLQVVIDVYERNACRTALS